jgi:hypothetical protein
MPADLELLIISALNGSLCFWRKEWPLERTPCTQRSAPFHLSSLRDGNPKRANALTIMSTGVSALRIRSNIHPQDQPHRRLDSIRLQGENCCLQVLIDPVCERSLPNEKNTCGDCGCGLPSHCFASAHP